MRTAGAASPLGAALSGLCAGGGASPTGCWRTFGAAPRGTPGGVLRFARFRQVQGYAYEVAGSVGLACLPIFGLDLAQGPDFAVALGEGFQLINIVRDAREDADADGSTSPWPTSPSTAWRKKNSWRAGAGPGRAGGLRTPGGRAALARADEEAKGWTGGA